jgi:hypothetical protein
MRRRVYLATIAGAMIGGIAGCSDGGDGSDGNSGSDGSDGADSSDSTEGTDTGTTGEETTADENTTTAGGSMSVLSERWEVELETNSVSGSTYDVDATADGILVGNTSGLYSITAGGDREWYWDEPSTFDEPGFETVVADGDTVFAVAHREGVVAALEAGSGDVRWRRSGSDTGLGVSGAVAGDYLATRHLGDGIATLERSSGGTAADIDAFGVQAGYGHEGTLVLTGVEGAAGYDPATGEQRWSIDGVEITGDGAVVGDRLVGFGEGQLVGVDLAAGEVAWTESLPEDIRDPTIAGGDGYAAVQWRRPEERIRVVEAGGGATRWDETFALQTIPFEPATSGGVVVADSDEGYLALGAEDGADLGSAQPVGLGAIDADAAGGTFYACSTTVTAYDI